VPAKTVAGEAKKLNTDFAPGGTRQGRFVRRQHRSAVGPQGRAPQP
jgi:hypothetical protein